jgi:hypothetical protein
MRKKIIVIIAILSIKNYCWTAKIRDFFRELGRQPRNYWEGMNVINIAEITGLAIDEINLRSLKSC